MKVKDLVDRALLELDETDTFLDARMEYACEECDLRSQIEAVVERAATAVALAADIAQIDEYLPLPRVVKYEDGIRYLDLPADFLRLVGLRMADWRAPETRVMSADSPMYSLRLYWERKGVTRFRHSPAVAISPAGERRRIEIFGSSAAAVRYGGYLPLPAVTPDGKVWIARGMVDPTIRRIKEEIIKIRA